MVNEVQLTVVGNVGGEPELRYTQSGVGVCSFSVGTTPRTFDRQKNEFVDGETTWFRVSVWREYAENVASSISKGTRVVVTGKLAVRQYETKEGEKRTSVEIVADEVAPSLRYATAMVQRIQRDSSQTRRVPPSDEAWVGANPDPTFEEPWATPTSSAGEAWADNTPF